MEFGCIYEKNQGKRNKEKEEGEGEENVCGLFGIKASALVGGKRRRMRSKIIFNLLLLIIYLITSLIYFGRKLSGCLR